MKMLSLAAVFAALFCLICPLSNYAVDDTASREDLPLYLNETKIMPVNNPTRIVIGNPSIVDVTDVGKTEVTLSPKNAGRTTLVIWDAFGEQSYQVRVFSENLDSLKEQIDNIVLDMGITGVYTKIQSEDGKVAVLGQVKTQAEKKKIDTALAGFKKKVIDLVDVKEEESVVEIDVQVMEIDSDSTKTLGFSLPLASSASGTGFTATQSAGEYSMSLGRTFDSIFHVFNWQRDAVFQMQVDYLIQEGKARVLSRPKLVCQSGKEALLLVGGEKPIMTTQVASVASGTASNSSQVQYKEYGIKLNIKPVVEGNRIHLDLKVGVDEVQAAEILGTSSSPTARAYPITRRTVNTQLYLQNGQTMAIGGIIKQKSEEDIRKTAFLGDIPILGALFRQRVTREGGGTGTRGNTELFITLTPTIVGRKVETQVNPEIKAATPAVEIAAGSPSKEPSSLSKAEPIDTVGQYASLVQRRIMDNLVYPSAAKKANFQGNVKLKLHISYNGDLLEAKVAQSSGYSELDENAMYVATTNSPYPPFPNAISRKDIWIDIPIQYSLN